MLGEEGLEPCGAHTPLPCRGSRDWPRGTAITSGTASEKGQ